MCFTLQEWFGEEEILSSSRRAFTAVAGENATMLLRVPVEEYRKVWGGAPWCKAHDGKGREGSGRVVGRWVMEVREPLGVCGKVG